MRLILYGTKTDRDEFMCSVTALPDLRYRKMQITGYLDYDSFITGLGCAYFHKKPVSPRVLSAAIAKCV